MSKIFAGKVGYVYYPALRRGNTLSKLTFAYIYFAHSLYIECVDNFDICGIIEL